MQHAAITCWNACNYCSVLHAVTAHETTTLSEMRDVHQRRAGGRTSLVVCWKLSRPPSVTMTASCWTLVMRAPLASVNRSVLSRRTAADVLVLPPTKSSRATVARMSDLHHQPNTRRTPIKRSSAPDAARQRCGAPRRTARRRMSPCTRRRIHTADALRCNAVPVSRDSACTSICRQREWKGKETGRRRRVRSAIIRGQQVDDISLELAPAVAAFHSSYRRAADAYTCREQLTPLCSTLSLRFVVDLLLYSKS